MTQRRAEQVNFRKEALMNCDKETVATIGGTKVFRLKGKSALFFRADIEIDADGSPRAYHPTNDKIALDFKANGFPFAVVHVNGKPHIQGPNDPAPGFFVSMTSLEDTSKEKTDPRRYVDSVEIPYIVLPSGLIGNGKAKLGDFAAVINKKNNKSSFAIFADVGPKKKLGEGSIALAAALEVKKNPKTGGPAADLIYVVFPGSGNGKPRSLDEVNSNGQVAFANFGGMEQVNACFGA
ncbi:MAG: hypothetical protein DMF72_08835 [Acidobacteria bacterium]|nr:MAG: hypothetical protein DMF72_08835 [Acidobacteriota bacterium]